MGFSASDDGLPVIAGISAAISENATDRAVQSIVRPAARTLPLFFSRKDLLCVLIKNMKTSAVL